MSALLKILLLVLATLTPVSAHCVEQEITQNFNELVRIEISLQTMVENFAKMTGADTRPADIYALQDIAAICETSRKQIHSLNSLYSAETLTTRGKKIQGKKEAVLREKNEYALKDFARRKIFIREILHTAEDQKLKDMAYLFEAQINKILKQLVLINKSFQ